MEFMREKYCVIVGGAKINDNEILKKYIVGCDYLIAADRGYESLKSINVIPNIVIGDFDSTEKPYDVETITLNPIKDSTDAEVSINKAIELGYNDIVLLGGLGGRIDHTFANFALICSYKEKGVNITAIDENHKIYALCNETHNIKNQGQYVSVFAFGTNAVVTFEGMCYPLDNYNMSAFQSLGVSNEIVNDTAKVITSDGILLVMEVFEKDF